jgi:hypothetical protein
VNVAPAAPPVLRRTRDLDNLRARFVRQPPHHGAADRAFQTLRHRRVSLLTADGHLGKHVSGRKEALHFVQDDQVEDALLIVILSAAKDLSSFPHEHYELKDRSPLDPAARSAAQSS